MVTKAARRWGGSLLIASLALCFSLPAALAQTLEIGGGGGYGFIGGEGSRTSVSALGAGVSWPADSKHKLRFDYLFTDFRNRIFESHFLTGSYVLQSRFGPVRPFFQAGAGVEVMRFDASRVNIPPEIPPSEVSFTSSGLALTLGAGASIDLGRSFFIRPELRTYLVVGPNAIVLPMITAGWRF